MTQVDFYILGSNLNDSRLRFACRITEKAVQQNHYVFVNSADDADALKLNGLLWTFSQGSFIPHVVMNKRLETPPMEPVLIGINSPETEDDVTNQLGENWDLMINLAPNIPGFFSRYARVAEVIDSDPIRREKGREHYRFYRDRGYELKIHNI